MTTWQCFDIGRNKARSDEFHGWRVTPASDLVELAPVTIDGPMTDERAIMLLDKIRHFEKHMTLRPLFDVLENKRGFAEVDHGYVTALILEKDDQQEETEI